MDYSFRCSTNSGRADTLEDNTIMTSSMYRPYMSSISRLSSDKMEHVLIEKGDFEYWTPDAVNTDKLPMCDSVFVFSAREPPSIPPVDTAN